MINDAMYNSQYSMAAFSIHPKDKAAAEHSGGLGEEND
jgi:hypothetical protein